MSSFETPLIVFTVLSQLSIGLVALSALRQLAGPAPQTEKARMEWIAAGLVLLAGLIASLLHLGHPAGMVRALSHLGTAWLSREAAGVGLFLILVAAGVWAMGNTPPKGLMLVTALVGLLAVLAMGMTYAPPSYPAINNVLP